MKKIFLSFVCLQLFVGNVLAQLAGRSFISGSAGINFATYSEGSSTSRNSYGYNFLIGLGRFKTETKVTGWNLSSNIGGGDAVYYLRGGDGSTILEHKPGIKNLGIGIGRFWSFYKHFNEKFGLFGGPGVNALYSLSSEYTYTTDQTSLESTQTNAISLSLDLSAGIYYRFSERWWATASLAFSNPVSVGYSAQSGISEITGRGKRTGEFRYALAPTFNLPSVGLGLRYFLRD